MKKTAIASAVSSAVLLSLAAAPSLVSGAVLEEVIVTAQKREESLQDVPVAITAVTGDFTFTGLTLTGGKTTLNTEDGGAIRSLTIGNLTLDRSIVRGNHTEGSNLGGANGACPPDAACDGNDRAHALNCFSNQNTLGDPLAYPCEQFPAAALNVDASGSTISCVQDSVCDAIDAIHAAEHAQILEQLELLKDEPDVGDAELAPCRVAQAGQVGPVGLDPP